MGHLRFYFNHGYLNQVELVGFWISRTRRKNVRLIELRINITWLNWVKNWLNEFLIFFNDLFNELVQPINLWLNKFDQLHQMPLNWSQIKVH